jgi:predicted RNase H-like HicB family nuclease
VVDPVYITTANEHCRQKRTKEMETKLKMVYWKGEKFWVGKLLEYPDIMTQGKTLKELEENLKEAYMLMTMEDVPEEHKVK